jgi:hypothetical protein
VALGARSRRASMHEGVTVCTCVPPISLINLNRTSHISRVARSENVQLLGVLYSSPGMHGRRCRRMHGSCTGAGATSAPALMWALVLHLPALMWHPLDAWPVPH